MPTSSTRKDIPATGFAPILTVAQVRNVEARHASAGLMERAGAAAAAVARDLAAGRAGSVVVLAGPGNNGGDGFVVARELARQFFDVVTVFRGDAGRLPADAAAAFAALAAAGGRVVQDPPAAQPALVVDALFGIGLTRAVDAPWRALVEWANASGAPVLALDVPTGVDADTGAVLATAIRAAATATFIALKPGLCTGDGLDCAGRVSLHALDVGLEPADGAGALLTWDRMARELPATLSRARRNVHKGTFGTLGIVGGANGMVGAPILAARAALKLGAGKTRVGFVADAAPAFDPGAPELMLGPAADVIDSDVDALVVGPGMGTSADARALIARALVLDVPLVIDADALNAIAADATLRAALLARKAPALLTPHPAEAARLLAIDTARVNADRPSTARALASQLKASVVLKGAGSVLATPEGALDVNGSGGPALATGGSGDVLSGMLGALLAQGIAPREALRVGVCLHGAAADHRVAQGHGPIGLSASELADAARALLNAAASGR